MDITHIQPFISHKTPWRRLLADDEIPNDITNAEEYDIPEENNGLNYQYLSTEDLLKESVETARRINSHMYSTRPVYEVIEKEINYIDEQGVEQTKTVTEEVITGYDPVETVRTGLIDMIFKQKASHFAKNGIEIAEEKVGKNKTDRDTFDIFCSWKDASGIDTGWLELIQVAGKCGDSALYPFWDGDDLTYVVFNPEDGDRLFPNRDDKGREMLARKYNLCGRTAVDIITVDEISTWVQGDPDSPNQNPIPGERTWWQKIKGWFTKDKDVYRKTADGWIRIARKDTQISENILQVIYLRFSDTFIGSAIQNINTLDRALSYTSDKMRSTAFSKLLVKAFQITNLPPTSSGEEVIGITGDAEQLKASDVKPIAPPDISNIAPINIKNIKDAIMESTMSVDLPPEILKSGADSSQTLKILLRREIQWCHAMWPKTYHAARRTMTVMKALVDKRERGGGKFSALRLSVWNTPWLPQDEDALADRVSKLSYAGFVSQKNGRRELNLQYSDDEELVRKEQEDKIYRETYFKLKAEADAKRDFGIDDTGSESSAESKPDGNKNNNSPNKDTTDPSRKGVDNNAPNR